MNLQSKQDLICHVAKVKVATSTHFMADVTHFQRTFYSLRIQSFYKTNTKICFAHNKENRENICNIVRVFMFQQRLEKHYRLRDSKLAEGNLRLSTDTQKNKPRADYEPRSAHGRAVNKPPSFSGKTILCA